MLVRQRQQRYNSSQQATLMMMTLTALCLVLVATVVNGIQPSLITSSSPGIARRTPSWQKKHVVALVPRGSNLAENDNNLLMLTTTLRGGSLDLPAEDTKGFVGKTRNMIRSLLEILDRKSPSMAQLFRSFIHLTEKLTNTRLLPQQPKKKKKKKHKKNNEESSTTDKKETESNQSTPKKKKKTSATSSATSSLSAKTQKHLETKLTNKSPNYRIQRELKEFIKSPPPHLSVKVGSNMRVWIITMVGAPNTIYEDEVYKLRVAFPKTYPTTPPSVYFLPPNIPQHEHVYTNGDICLSLLGNGWRPTMTAQSIAVSILSILSSATKKELPMDNARHSQNKPGQYQKDWVYHDDNA